MFYDSVTNCLTKANCYLKVLSYFYNRPNITNWAEVSVNPSIV